MTTKPASPPSPVSDLSQPHQYDEPQSSQSASGNPTMEPSPVKAEQWKIRIAGYDIFDFTGSEQEAEHRRIDHARFAQATGIKWCVSSPKEVDKLTELMAWYFDNGGCPPWLYRARLKAIKEAKDA